jgi:hypothetical protein
MRTRISSDWLAFTICARSSGAGAGGAGALGGRIPDRAVVSRRVRLIPLRNGLFTPELQWQSRGTMAYLTGVQTGNARGSARIVRGRSPAEFDWLAGRPPKAKDGSRGPETVFLMGPDGLLRLLIIATNLAAHSENTTIRGPSETTALLHLEQQSLLHALLKEVGFPPLLIYDAIRDGYVFELVVLRGGDQMAHVPVRATWHGVVSLVKSCWGPLVSGIVERHQQSLQETAFDDLQGDYGYSMFHAQHQGPDCEWYAFPPCEVHTVYAWRILQGGARVHSHSRPSL